jgi:Tfp pilus assembly protein PilF
MARSEEILEKAITAYKSGNYSKAEELYRTLLKIFPGHPPVYAGLGHALKAQQKFAEAISYFEAAIQIDPSDPEVMNSLAMGFHDQGRFDEAERWYRKAIAIAPDFVEAHSNLGCALQDEGRCAESIESYREALRLAPHYVGTAHNLHTALFDDQDLSPAATLLEDVLRIQPGWHLAHFYLGVIRELQGDAKAATVHFDVLNSQAKERERDVKPLLESWDYVRKARGPKTRFFGDSFATIRYAASHIEVDGLALEFGVNFGSSIKYIAGLISRDVHGFDSFKGLPEAWQNKPVGSYSTDGILPNVPANVHLHVGWFSHTLPGFLAEHEGPVSFMNMDCDIYSSTKTVFDHLGDRVVPGTVIVFDEYLINPGWQDDEFKAFQEAVSQYSWQYEYLAFSVTAKQAVVRILPS